MSTSRLLYRCMYFDSKSFQFLFFFISPWVYLQEYSCRKINSVHIFIYRYYAYPMANKTNGERLEKVSGGLYRTP